jgi:hypothetical protein
MKADMPYRHFAGYGAAYNMLSDLKKRDPTRIIRAFAQ